VPFDASIDNQRGEVAREEDVVEAITDPAALEGAGLRPRVENWERVHLDEGTVWIKQRGQVCRRLTDDSGALVEITRQPMARPLASWRAGGDGKPSRSSVNSPRIRRPPLRVAPSAAQRRAPAAQLAAEASEAVAAQGAFWQMHDLLLDHQGELGPKD
jgi:hypothetical protein